MEAPTIDRTSCALKARTGSEDPAEATYTCAGCGTVVIGYGRWRNHMKRAKVAQGQRNKSGKLRGVVKGGGGGGASGASGAKKPTSAGGGASSGSFGAKKAVVDRSAGLAVHQEHKQATLPPKQPPAEAAGGGGGGGSSFDAAKKFAGARPGYVFKSGASGVGYYHDGPAAAKPAAKPKPAASGATEWQAPGVAAAKPKANVVGDDGKRKRVRGAANDVRRQAYLEKLKAAGKI